MRTMKVLGALALLLLTGCGQVDGRRGVVVVAGPVDRVALSVAIDGLRAGTDGDTDLTLASECQKHRYCIVVVAVDGYECPDDVELDGSGGRCAGVTNRPGDEGVIVHLDSVDGNNAATMAHELLHAVGVTDHDTGSNHSELMNNYRDLSLDERVFGAATARLYESAFGIRPVGGVSFGTR